MRASSRSIWMMLLVVCASWPCGVFAEENDSLPTILLEKKSSKSITQAVLAPSPDRIDFTIMPLNCTVDDLISKVTYSYSDGCNMEMSWEELDGFRTQKEGVKNKKIAAASESTNISISIQDEKVKFETTHAQPFCNDACPVKNEQLPGGTGGYLLNFTVWSLEDLQCDIQLSFPLDYYFYKEPEATTVNPPEFPGVNESAGVNESKISTMQIVFISIGATGLLCVFALLGFVLWCCKNGYCKKKRSPLPVSSLPPPVSSPPLMVVSCISSSEKPPKTAVPVSSNEKPNTPEALANASKQVTERTTEAVTVDPHTGAKQPKRLTEAQFRAHAIEYMRRVREKEAREEAEEAAGNTEAETAITEKTLDPTQKSADSKKTVDATQKSVDAKKTLDATQKSIDAKKSVEATQKSVDDNKSVKATQKTQEANKPGVGKR